MKTRIALFEYNSPTMRGLTTYLSESEAKYLSANKTRISKFIEVEFPPRTAEEVVPEQIAALDAQIAEVTEKFGRALGELKARKSELLAITNQAEVVE